MGSRTTPGDVIDVSPVVRPQPVPDGGFLLDVGLGSLARRLRLLGLDAAYDSAAGDAAPVERATAEDRVLLTQDRGVLMRRALAAGALIRGAGAQQQLADVLVSGAGAGPADPVHGVRADLLARRARPADRRAGGAPQVGPRGPPAGPSSSGMSVAGRRLGP